MTNSSRCGRKAHAGFLLGLLSLALGIFAALTTFYPLLLGVLGGSVLSIILGFLGIITILIILYGGLIWMTSFGNEDKIDQAKKLITSGIVGLVVVLASYAIATFVVNSLSQAV